LVVNSILARLKHEEERVNALVVLNLYIEVV